ncbi:MAG TPA: hypothetical protein VKS44_06160 [Candidatus Acidoferrales bacterium]|nr:hypothetical protein [Candidatus Acidoferrales bacterium]
MNLIWPVVLKRKRFVLALAATGVGIFAFTHAARGQAPSASATQTDAPQSATSKTSSAASSAAAGDALSVGRVIYAELTQTIDARKAKIGEPIAARVTLAVLSCGKVLIADGAKISGHVTEAKRRSQKNPESVLGIVFDRAELKEGGEVPLALTVQAVGIGGFSTGSMASASADPDSHYSGAAALPGVSGRGAGSAMTPATAELPEAARQPALDLGSKGVIGLSNLQLEEGTETTKGSLLTSTSKDVKLDHGDELVLRVIASKATPAGTK